MSSSARPGPGTTTFWVFGLFLCLFVGPAQSSSRAYLARLAPHGESGELFGLYATTGRAVSFLAPALFTLCIAVASPLVAPGEAQRWGILGIMVVLLAGLLVLLPVKPPGKVRNRRGPRRLSGSGNSAVSKPQLPPRGLGWCHERG